MQGIDTGKSVNTIWDLYDIPFTPENTVIVCGVKILLPCSGFVGKNLTLEKFSTLNEDQKIELKSNLWRENKDWLNHKFQELNAAWITVIDGKVKTFSSDIDEFPDESDILKICKDNDSKFPFIFDNPRFLMIEESHWSETIYPDDYYPTVPIQIKSPTSTKIRNYIADFDTGSSEIHMNRELLISEGLICISETDDIDSNTHLGKNYAYCRKKFYVGIVTEKDEIKQTELSVVCVKDWGESPFVEINTSRLVLVGRRLFQKIKAIVLLDFTGHRKTKIYS
ncbi:MAG: hypothetical protein QME42_06140 [bacterium]|nr:hypothetical protein [bacterium]